MYISNMYCYYTRIYIYIKTFVYTQTTSALAGSGKIVSEFLGTPRKTNNCPIAASHVWDERPPQTALIYYICPANSFLADSSNTLVLFEDLIAVDNKVHIVFASPLQKKQSLPPGNRHPGTHKQKDTKSNRHI